jgi:hypothetical protein
MYVNVVELHGMKIIFLCVDVHKDTQLKLFMFTVLIYVLTVYVIAMTRTLDEGLQMYFGIKRWLDVWITSKVNNMVGLLNQ